MPTTDQRASHREAECGFIGTYHRFQSFRRRNRVADRFRYIGGSADTRGRRFDYVVTDWQLTIDQENVLQWLMSDNPDVQVHPLSDDVLYKHPIPDDILVHINTVACMWCGEEVGKAVIEAHEAVCGA